MKFIIKNLSASTMVSHVKDFIRPVLCGGFFKRKLAVQKVVIHKHALVIEDDIEYYALVSIEPDAVGKRVVGALHKKMLQGKSVAVEQYYDRYCNNERRKFAGRDVTLANDRRKGERRRCYVNVEITSDTGV